MKTTTLVMLVALVLSICPSIQAATTYTDWDGDTSIVWSNGNNWVGGSAPVSASGADNLNVARFNDPSAATYQPTITGTTSVTGVSFTVGGWTLGGAGQTLTVVNTSAIGFSGGSGVVNVNCNVSYTKASITTNVAAGGTLIFNGTTNKSGSTLWAFQGGGTVVFNNTVTSAAELKVNASAIIFRLGVNLDGSSGGFWVADPVGSLTLMADNSSRDIGCGIRSDLGESPTIVLGDASNTYLGTLSVSGAISSALAISKVGNSTLNLSRAVGNAYTGGTVVSAGTLLATNTSGSATGTGAVTVKNGARLGGGGYITGATTVESGGHLTPGQSIGTLHLGSVNFQGGAVLDLEYDETTGDLVEATSLSFGATATLNLTWVGAGDGPTTDLDRVLFNFGGSAPTNPTWTINGLPTGATGEVTIQGSQVILHLTAATVPEPATLALLALGGLGLAGSAVRRRHAH
ncbi:MAG: hypothetical protein BIFFINMI_00176 [Phycisphaerae bacterium]|nr:hypothetical protein [Phycisphaerae bacterium]